VFPELISQHRLHCGSLYEPDLAISSAKNATWEGRSSQRQQQARSCFLLAELQTGVDPVRLAHDLVDRATGTGATFDQAGPGREFELVFELRARRTDRQ
jgi:hypothetical protein